MLRYIVRRVLWGIALLFMVSAVIFVIFYVFPSADPAKLRAGRNASPDTIRQIRKELDLNEPIYVQYKNFMVGADSYVHVDGDFPFVHVYLHGGQTGGVFTPQFSFGQSYYSQAPVKEIIFDRLPATALLVAGAVFFWLLMGIPVAALGILHQREIARPQQRVPAAHQVAHPRLRAQVRRAVLLLAEHVGVQVYQAIEVDGCRPAQHQPAAKLAAVVGRAHILC